jgi:hypothetical protein
LRETIEDKVQLDGLTRNMELADDGNDEEQVLSAEFRLISQDSPFFTESPTPFFF